MSEENLKQLKEDSTKTDGNTLMRYIRVLSELSNQLRYASQKRVMVEVALIKLTRPSMEPDMDSVLQPLKQLEAAVRRSGGRWIYTESRYAAPGGNVTGKCRYAGSAAPNGSYPGAGSRHAGCSIRKCF